MALNLAAPWAAFSGTQRCARIALRFPRFVMPHRPSHSALVTGSGSAQHCSSTQTAVFASADTPSEASGATPADAGIDIRDLADKAKLRLTAAEASEFEASISRIVGWFGQLQSADVADVEPAIHAAVFGESGLDSLRADEPVVFGARAEMLEAAPSLEGQYLKVPRILGSDVSE